MFSVQQRIYYSIRKGVYDPTIYILLTLKISSKRKEESFQDKQI